MVITIAPPVFVIGVQRVTNPYSVTNRILSNDFVNCKQPNAITTYFLEYNSISMFIYDNIVHNENKVIPANYGLEQTGEDLLIYAIL